MKAWIFVSNAVDQEEADQVAVLIMNETDEATEDYDTQLNDKEQGYFFFTN